MTKKIVAAGLPGLSISLVFFLSGSSVLTALLPGAITAVLFWLFTRSPGPEKELPCSSVSCCHYLKNQKEESINE